MQITKFGQSCLLIEEADAHIVMDPGSFSTAQNTLEHIDLILITHDHQDHLDINSLKEVLSHNPSAKIYSTAIVKSMLDKESIESSVITSGEVVTEKGITVEAFGEKHAILVNSIPQSENVGFMIAEKLFYPGDALTLPGKPLEILALPAAAPWAKLSEIVDFALAVKPKVTFPVHDSILSNPSMMQGFFAPLLANAGIEFKPVELNTPYTF